MPIMWKTALAHKSNYGGMRLTSAIKYVVLHYTANDGDTDEANGSYFQGANRQASAHYFVDDDSITRSVPDNYVAWAVGGAKWGDCAKTGGGKLYGIATNANSISIEMCDTVRDGKVIATEKTMENAEALCRELMEKYNIDIDHVIRHFDVNGKHCPEYFMDNASWEKFKDRIRKPEFKVGKTYVTTQDCWLRSSAGVTDNRVPYKGLSLALKAKCRKKADHAIFKSGKSFKLVKTKTVDKDIWGQMYSGYWVPLVYNGKARAK